MGNILLTVLYGSCLFPSGFPCDSKAVLHHLISTCKDPPFYAGGRSFYNREQLDSNCPGEVQKAVGRKASLQALARSLIGREIVIGLEGRPISLFSALLCFLISIFPSAFLFVSKINHVILLTALSLPVFIVLNSK